MIPLKTGDEAEYVLASEREREGGRVWNVVYWLMDTVKVRS